MTRNAGTLRGPVASEHIVQLFDTTDSLIDVLSSFVKEGLDHTAAVLVVARPRLWDAVAVTLVQQGVAVAKAIAEGHITVLSAASTMARFMRNEAPDAELFRNTVRPVVARLAAASPERLYIYGEMVDLLAEEGDFGAAEQLEILWNGLAAEFSFRLLCGYSAAHFAAPKAGSALNKICRAHSHVRTDIADPLGMWLIETDSPDSNPDQRPVTDVAQ